jgi:signal transduction histidine kinase
MPALTAAALLVAVAAAVAWSRRPAAVLAGGCAVAGMSLADTAFAGPADGGTGYWLLLELIVTLVVIAKVVRWLPVPAAVAVAALLVLAVGLSPLRVARWLRPPAPAWETVAVCASMATLAGLAVAAGAYLRALDRARARVVAATRREQRLTLARDLHDWFAHEVTGIVLEAQASQLDGGDPRPAFARIEQAGQRALESMDRALALMRSPRPERVPGLTEIGAVVHRFARSSRMSVELDAAPTGALRPEIADTAHRIVAESLTNIRRHAGTVGHVLVRIRRDADTLTVSVTNEGAGRRASWRRGGPRADGYRGGTGLAALADRVAALGGTLQAGPHETRGWCVHAVLPVPP